MHVARGAARFGGRPPRASESVTDPLQEPLGRQPRVWQRARMDWRQLACVTLLLAGCQTCTSRTQPDTAPAVHLDAGSPRDGGSDADASTTDAGMLRVLFVGNSYTYVNDLPEVVREL